MPPLTRCRNVSKEVVEGAFDCLRDVGNYYKKVKENMPVDDIINMAMAIGQRATEEEQKAMGGDRRPVSSGMGSGDDEGMDKLWHFMRRVESAAMDNIRDYAAMIKFADAACKIAEHKMCYMKKSPMSICIDVNWDVAPWPKFDWFKWLEGQVDNVCR